MIIMKLLALLSLWLYISTATTQSVGNDFNFMYTPLTEQGLTATQAIAIRNLLKYGHPTPRQDDAQLDLQTCEENLQGLTARLELMETENNNKGPVNEEGNVLQEVQTVLQELQAKEASINHTLTTHEAELDRYKDEVASLTRKIQDQQSVIQNIRSTLPGCVSGAVFYNNGDHSADNCFPLQCFGGTMSPVLHHTKGRQCVEPFESFLGACYHYNNTIHMTWCEARNTCVDHGGDLAIHNFNTLKDLFNFKHTNPSERGPWVGVRNTKWLTGQEPQRQQWRSGQPDAEDQCGRLWFDGLHDDTCDTKRPFICQLYD